VIIDSHVHVKGGDQYRRELDADRTLYRMDQAGIDKSIVFLICLPSRESNELTWRAVRGREDRLIPYAHAVLLEGIVALRETRSAVEAGCRGVKVHLGELGGTTSRKSLAPGWVTFFDGKAGLTEADLKVVLDVVDTGKITCSHACVEWSDIWAKAINDEQVEVINGEQPMAVALDKITPAALDIMQRTAPRA
jgi:hypothetical protein